MNNYNCKIWIKYESYNGYDLKESSQVEIVAKNPQSAENKAKIWAKRNCGSLSRGYIERIEVELK